MSPRVTTVSRLRRRQVNHEARVTNDGRGLLTVHQHVHAMAPGEEVHVKGEELKWILADKIGYWKVGDAHVTELYNVIDYFDPYRNPVRARHCCVASTRAAARSSRHCRVASARAAARSSRHSVVWGRRSRARSLALCCAHLPNSDHRPTVFTPPLEAHARDSSDQLRRQSSVLRWRDGGTRARPLRWRDARATDARVLLLLRHRACVTRGRAGGRRVVLSLPTCRCTRPRPSRSSTRSSAEGRRRCVTEWNGMEWNGMEWTLARVRRAGAGAGARGDRLEPHVMSCRVMSCNVV